MAAFTFVVVLFGRFVVLETRCGAIWAVCGFGNALCCNLGCLWFWKRVVVQFRCVVFCHKRLWFADALGSLKLLG